MQRIKHCTSLLRALLITLVLLSAPISGGVATAQESSPETAEEYFNTLRSMDNLSIYGEYGELETIHSRSLTEVQVGDFTESERQKLDAVIGLLRTFSNASKNAGNGEYRPALHSAEQSGTYIDSLEERDETLGVLARLALSRFYENLGNELSSEADNVDRTAVEIDLRSMAAVSFQRANVPEQAAEFIRQSERLRANYNADLEYMNQTASKARTFLGSCQQCISPLGAIANLGPGVFARYDDARATYRAAADAEQRATQHGLSKRAITFSDLTSQAAATWGSLAIAAAVLMLLYGLVIAVVAMTVTLRVRSWERAYLDARIDTVVAIGDNDV